MQNSIAAANFHPFVLSEELQFSLTQFADDTVSLGDSNRENILDVKVMLRGFELLSGLKVNFSKSKVIGVNLDDGFLEVASNFLSCATTSLPFNFLGIPIGANPRRKITWEPLVTKIRNKLSLWRGKHISFGSRLTLINSVLNSIPVFLFSFYCAPKLVLQEIINIQRAFYGKGRNKNVESIGLHGRIFVNQKQMVGWESKTVKLSILLFYLNGLGNSVQILRIWEHRFLLSVMAILRGFFLNHRDSLPIC
ncbi:unnamed protein product [Lathyrus sativus]|nr:unnamed protein product [Lathyrus sativus]